MPKHYTFIKPSDTVKMIDSSYFGKENQGQLFTVLFHQRDFTEALQCKKENPLTWKNCTCWQGYQIINLKTSEILSNVMVDEITLVKING